MERLLRLLLFKKQFNNEKEYEMARKKAAFSTLYLSRVVVPLIIVFELIMIVLWFINNGDFHTFKSLGYFLCYSILLVVSCLVILFSKLISKDVNKNFEYVAIVEDIYAICILLWSVCITYLDAYDSTYINVLVYATILLVLPIVVFIQPYKFLILHAFGFVSILLLIISRGTEVFLSVGINFIVFSAVSLVIAISFYNVRLISIKNEIKLEKLSEVDSLTSLYNRQKLNSVGKEIYEQCVKNNQTLSCIMCDIDDFKKINDTYGHLRGDEVLIEIGTILNKYTNSIDSFAYRYGGEEFTLLFIGKSKEDVKSIVSDIQKDLKSVTLSFGLYHNQATNNFKIEGFLSYADDLLYQSKNNGKNRLTSN